jgi:ketosteroid isomerase-like protein
MPSEDGQCANADLVRRFYRALADHDLTTLAALVSDDFVDHTHQPDSTGARIGRAALLAHTARVHELVGAVRIVLEDVLAQGDRVVTRWALAVSDDAPACGPAWQASVRGISIHRLQAGQLVERWVALSI